MLSTISELLSLIRFSHTLFALPFALLAAIMAWHESGFSWRQLIGILLAMVTARSAAMAFNRIVDRKIDGDNPRTAGRHLPAGKLSLSQVATFTVACGFAFTTSTLLFLPNRLPLYLSFPVLLFLFGYSYTKRFTSLSHVWLGAALASSPVAAWIAIRGEEVLRDPSDLAPALVLGGAVLTWVTGFDIIYSCQDLQFDRQRGLHSIPARWGVAGALKIAALAHLATILLLACSPLVYPSFGWLFWGAVLVVAALLIYEHAQVRPEDLDRVNIAFFHVNAVISVLLLAVGTLDLWLGCK